MKYKVTDAELTSIANAIRTKGGTSSDLVYPDGFISAISNIPSGGGSTLITKSITENGTYNASSDSADGYSSVTVNVAASASKMVTGTFTGDSAGALAVTVPYSGSGYPIAGIVFPSDGAWEANSGIPELIRKNCIIMWAFGKIDTSTTPDYSSDTDDNKAEAFYYTKTSDSSASTTGAGRVHQSRIFNSNTNASAYYDSAIRMKSATSMSVYISDSGTGFIKDVEYTYLLIYSS